MMSRFQSLSVGTVLISVFVCWNIRESTGFVPSIVGKRVTLVTTRSTYTGIRFFQGLSASTNSEGTDHTNNDGNVEEPPRKPTTATDEEGQTESPPIEMDTSTIRIQDDGMTDRFKYKVHALMGDYDPTEGMVDDEGQDGNIMKALLTFPTQHIFDVVGKIRNDDADDDVNSSSRSNDYAEKVKSIVFETTGDEDIRCDIFPRGKKFVKVRCEAKVESTAMINTIYDELGDMESTVMKF